jgi:hypothetical protein
MTIIKAAAIVAGSIALTSLTTIFLKLINDYIL